MKKKLTILPLAVTGLGLALVGVAPEEAKANVIPTAQPSVDQNITPPTKPVVTETKAEVAKAVEGQEVDVRVLATTDLHTNLVNYDYYQDKPAENLGLANTAVLIEQAKKENSNVVLVDNGDTIQGTPLGTYKATVDPIEKGEQHPMYAALEKLGYDAGTLGNHEFNYGLDYLDKVISTADIPLLNANVFDATTGAHRYTPYKILEKTFKDTKGESVMFKVGITGIVPPQILTWDKAYLEGKVKVEDSIVALNKIVPKIKEEGADVVVVLSHSGIGDEKYEVGEENIAYHITKIPGVDAIITGHSHGEFPNKVKPGSYEKLPGANAEKGQINGKPIVMAGKYGDHLGIIDLKVKYANGKWGVVDSQGTIKKLDPKDGLVNQDVLSIAKEAHEGTVKYVNEKVGETKDDINSYFALVQDDPSIQIVNQAQLWFAKKELQGTEFEKLPLLSAAAPFKAGTRDDATAYTDIKKGALAIKNVADLYLYDNITAVLKLNGAQIKEWLEMSAGQFNTVDPNKKNEAQSIVNTSYRTYNFDVIDGLQYDIDITQKNKYDRDGKLVNANSERIKNLTYKGQAVDPKQDFIVVTNNYRMSGNFPGVKDAAYKKLLSLENRQAIINYIVSEKEITPTADFNWNFANTIEGLNLTFKTAQSAKYLLERYKNITYVADSESGFGTYKYNYKPREVKEETPQPEFSTGNVVPGTVDSMISKSVKIELSQEKIGNVTSTFDKEIKAINTTKEAAAGTYSNAKKEDVQTLGGDKVLPKTSAYSESNNTAIPLALASILIAAGLMSRKKNH